MSHRTYSIPSPPPITDAMTTGATGADASDLIGHAVVTTYDVPDSDRREVLLLLDNGRVYELSTDPGYNDDLAVSRNHERWEFFMYDATDTPAGDAMKKLAPGRWW